jgi:hypothetical protein
MANYLNNHDLLNAITKVKLTYCEILDSRYQFFDLVVEDLSQVTHQALLQARIDKAHEMVFRKRKALRAEGLNKEAAAYDLDPESLSLDDIVIRVMTMSHIPDDVEKLYGRNKRGTCKANTNFEPFKQYVLVNDQFVEVVRSHWRGDFTTGEFCPDRGRVSNELARMYMLLVDNIAKRPNWRYYTYLDEMRCQALLSLTKYGLKFNEAKSKNPFAFYTTVVNNAFLMILNDEKKSQVIRDDLLEMAGQSSSMTRQIQHEYEQMLKRESLDVPDDLTTTESVGVTPSPEDVSSGHCGGIF